MGENLAAIRRRGTRLAGSRSAGAMSGGFENLKALIVEDNSHMRSLLRALLNSVGMMDVSEASHGQTGIEALRRCRPDLVLTDLAMKPMDGLEFTRFIRNDPLSPNPFIPII